MLCFATQGFQYSFFQSLSPSRLISTNRICHADHRRNESAPGFGIHTTNIIAKKKSSGDKLEKKKDPQQGESRGFGNTDDLGPSPIGAHLDPRRSASRGGAGDADPEQELTPWERERRMDEALQKMGFDKPSESRRMDEQLREKKRLENEKRSKEREVLERFNIGTSESESNIPDKTLYESLVSVFGFEAVNGVEKVLELALGVLGIGFILGGLAISSEAYFKAAQKDIPASFDANVSLVAQWFTPSLGVFLVCSILYGILKQSQVKSYTGTYQEIIPPNNDTTKTKSTKSKKSKK